MTSVGAPVPCQWPGAAPGDGSRPSTSGLPCKPAEGAPAARTSPVMNKGTDDFCPSTHLWDPGKGHPQRLQRRRGGQESGALKKAPILSSQCCLPRSQQRKASGFIPNLGSSLEVRMASLNCSSQPANFLRSEPLACPICPPPPAPRT